MRIVGDARVHSTIRWNETLRPDTMSNIMPTTAPALLRQDFTLVSEKGVEITIPLYSMR